MVFTDLALLLSFHPFCRALNSHISDCCFCDNKANSAFSRASSQVSIPELHLSASFWYCDVSFLASRSAMSARCWLSKDSASRSFSSSDRSSEKFFSVSPVTSGSCFAQSVKMELEFEILRLKWYLNHFLQVWNGIGFQFRSNPFK